MLWNFLVNKVFAKQKHFKFIKKKKNVSLKITFPSYKSSYIQSIDHQIEWIFLEEQKKCKEYCKYTEKTFAIKKYLYILIQNFPTPNIQQQFISYKNIMEIFPLKNKVSVGFSSSLSFSFHSFHIEVKQISVLFFRLFFLLFLLCKRTKKMNKVKMQWKNFIGDVETQVFFHLLPHLFSNDFKSAKNFSTIIFKYK